MGSHHGYLMGIERFNSMNTGDLIALLALAVSALSLFFTLFWNSPIGVVSPLEPSGFAVMRGIGTEQGIGPFSSDHLVLPMQWKNASGRPVVVQRPELHLHTIRKGNKSKKPLVFTLAGEYPDISTGSFCERYSHNNSLLIEPHSVSINTLVFHHIDYWTKDFSFFFTKGEEYEVVVTFTRNSGLGWVLQRILATVRKPYADGSFAKFGT